MRCEKCGNEMKWVGSIARGNMECPSCIHKGSNEKQASFEITDTRAGNEPVAGFILVCPPFHPNHGDRVDVAQWCAWASPYICSVRADGNDAWIYAFDWHHHTNGHYKFEVRLSKKDYYNGKFVGEVI